MAKSTKEKTSKKSVKDDSEKVKKAKSKTAKVLRKAEAKAEKPKKKKGPNYEDLSVDLAKSEKSKIQVSVQEYAGKPYLDIRHFYKDKEGKWCPTKKGCSIPAQLTVKLRKKIATLVRRMDEAGVESDSE